jgi:Ca2+-binding EF-hand superfamily protein
MIFSQKIQKKSNILKRKQNKSQEAKMNSFHPLDVNRDGLITRADFLQAGSVFGPAGSAMGGQLFDHFDANKDGVLNRFEAENASKAIGGMI